MFRPPSLGPPSFPICCHFPPENKPVLTCFLACEGLTVLHLSPSTMVKTTPFASQVALVLSLERSPAQLHSLHALRCSVVPIFYMGISPTILSKEHWQWISSKSFHFTLLAICSLKHKQGFSESIVGEIIVKSPYESLLSVPGVWKHDSLALLFPTIWCNRSLATWLDSTSLHAGNKAGACFSNLSSSRSVLDSILLQRSPNIAHYEYMALAKNTSVLREAMPLFCEPAWSAVNNKAVTCSEYADTFLRLSIRSSQHEATSWQTIKHTYINTHNQLIIQLQL